MQGTGRSYGSVSKDPYPQWAPNQNPDKEPLIANPSPAFQPPSQPPGQAQPQDQVYAAPIDNDPRPKNWPACKPIVHHNIDGEIPPHHSSFVRQAYIGWYFHAFCLLYNFVCMMGGIVKGEVLTSFFIALAALILGIPISFWVYWLVYSAVRFCCI